jgi:hypothetical protein
MSDIQHKLFSSDYLSTFSEKWGGLNVQGPFLVNKQYPAIPRGPLEGGIKSQSCLL